MKAWRQEDVDPYYTRFHTLLRDEESLDGMVAPIQRRFAKSGLRTAIVTEKEGEGYLLHCIAVRLLRGEIPKVVSDQVEAGTLDGLQVAGVKRAEIEPLGIHFGIPKF